METNRRKFDNMTDHDLIIAHSVKIDTLCKLVRSNNTHFLNFSDRFDSQLSAFSDKLDARCIHTHDSISNTHKEIFAKVDGKTDNMTFRWLVGIIVFVILALAGVVGSDYADIHANKGAIIQIESCIDDMKKEIF